MQERFAESQKAIEFTVKSASNYFEFAEYILDTKNPDQYGFVYSTDEIQGREGFIVGNSEKTTVNSIFVTNRPYLEAELSYFEKSLNIKLTNVYFGQMVGENLLIKGFFKLNR